MRHSELFLITHGTYHGLEAPVLIIADLDLTSFVPGLLEEPDRQEEQGKETQPQENLNYYRNIKPYDARRYFHSSAEVEALQELLDRGHLRYIPFPTRMVSLKMFETPTTSSTSSATRGDALPNADEIEDQMMDVTLAQVTESQLASKWNTVTMDDIRHLPRSDNTQLLFERLLRERPDHFLCRRHRHTCMKIFDTIKRKKPCLLMAFHGRHSTNLHTYVVERLSFKRPLSDKEWKFMFETFQKQYEVYRDWFPLFPSADDMNPLRIHVAYEGSDIRVTDMCMHIPDMQVQQRAEISLPSKQEMDVYIDEIKSRPRPDGIVSESDIAEYNTSALLEKIHSHIQSTSKLYPNPAHPEQSISVEDMQKHKQHDAVTTTIVTSDPLLLANEMDMDTLLSTQLASRQLVDVDRTSYREKSYLADRLSASSNADKTLVSMFHETEVNLLYSLISFFVCARSGCIDTAKLSEAPNELTRMFRVMHVGSHSGFSKDRIIGKLKKRLHSSKKWMADLMWMIYEHRHLPCGRTFWQTLSDEYVADLHQLQIKTNLFEQVIKYFATT